MKGKSLKKLTAFCVAGVAFLGAFGALCATESVLRAKQQTAIESLKGKEYAKDSIVLSDTTAAEAERLAEELNAELRMNTNGTFATLTLTDGRTIDEVYASRKYRNLLPEFSPDYKTSVSELAIEPTTSAPDYQVADEYYSSQEYLNYLHIGKTWQKTKGSYATVAIIDTGIDTDHPEFAGRISAYSYNATEDRAVYERWVDGGYDYSIVEDEQGHGTAVAGVIGAAMQGEGVVGIAPETKLLIIKAECDKDGRFERTSDLVFGLYYAIERGVDVVNMSFGGYGENLYAEATKLAKNANVVCVASAGNSPTANFSYPAADENVIGVGSLAENSFTLADYSAYGENVDLVAPGSVYTTAMGGGYEYKTGTSFSAPMVSAAVALSITSSYGYAAQAREKLIYSAHDLGEKGKDFQYGFGLIDIERYLNGPWHTVTFDMMTADLENEKIEVASGAVLQEYPEPTKLYSVFTGWYYDKHCTQRVEYYDEIFTKDVTFYAGWENESVVDGKYLFSYIVKADATVEITGYNGKRTSIVIPELIDGKKVTSIGERAFEEGKFYKISLPETLVKIGDSAFNKCFKLLEINLPDGVEELGKNAFSNTPSLRNFKMTSESKLTKISAGAFFGSGLREFILPSGVTVIEKNAFSCAVRLGKFDFSNNAVLKEIQSNAFASTALSALTVPKSVEKIEGGAFSGTNLQTLNFEKESKLTQLNELVFANTRLTSVTLPATLTEVSTRAFFMTRTLKEILVEDGNRYFRSEKGVLYDYAKNTLLIYPLGRTEEDFAVPMGVTAIADYAFTYSPVKRVDLGEVERINDLAFAYSDLESLELPKSITTLGYGAFAYSEIQELKIEAELTALTDYAFFYCKRLRSVEIPASVAVVGGYAFAGTGVESVTFKEGSQIAALTTGAFSGTFNLKNILIPDSVTVLGESVFGSCATFFDGVGVWLNASAVNRVQVTEQSSLRTIGYGAFTDVKISSFYFPNGLTSIGEQAFFGTDLSYVRLRKELTSLGDGAFANIQELSNIEVENGNQEFSSLDGVLFNADKSLLMQYPLGKAGEEYVIPSGVTDIKSLAFAGVALKKLYLPDTMTVIPDRYFQNYAMEEFVFDSGTISIGEEAFLDNLNLRRVTLPDSLTELGRGAFQGCEKLETVIFGENSALARLSSGVFRNTKISSLRIPKNISSIAVDALWDCKELTEVVFATGSRLDMLTAGLFKGCSSLASVTFEEGSALKTIGASSFTGLVSLQKLDLGGAAVEEIGAFAFRGCDGLTELILPDSLRVIGRFAFAFAVGLRRLDIPSNLAYIGEFAFYGTEELRVYFKADELPETLEEAWDEGLLGYYMGVQEVIVEGDFEYADLLNGGVALVRYLGTETALDLTAFPFGTLTGIGANAFYRSTVETILLPQTVKSIQAYAFAYSALRTIEIPSSVTIIGNGAFIGSALEEITFAQDGALKKIERYAFSECKALQEVSLPNSLEELGKFAFYNSGLTAVEFAGDGALSVISESAFAATPLTAVTLPNSVTLVDYNAFRDNRSLVSVTLQGESLEISENAFYNSGLTTLKIATGVQFIGEYAFAGLVNLTAFEVDENNPYYSEKDGILYDKSGQTLLFAPAGRTEKIVVEKTVEQIGNGAFENSAASEIVFEKGSRLYSIGARTFYGARNITQLILPKSVTAIEYYAFAYCAQLETVIFEQGSRLNALYEGVFYGCESLTSLVLPNAVEDIAPYAFYGCTGLTALPVGIENVYMVGEYAFAYTGITEFVFSDALAELGEYAFKGSKIESFIVPTTSEFITLGYGLLAECNDLKELSVPNFGGNGYEEYLGRLFGAASAMTQLSYIPDSLEKVRVFGEVIGFDFSAFRYAKGLKELYLPAIVTTSFDRNSLNGSYNVEWIEIEEGGRYVSTEGSLYDLQSGSFACIPSKVKKAHLLEGMKGSGFSSKQELRSVVIEEGVVLERSAFAYCSALTEVVFAGDVTEIPEHCFERCVALDNVKLPSGLKVIGESAFEWTALSSIVIPNEVHTIGQWAFRNTKITEISIPDSVTNLGDAFYNLKLTKISVGSGVDSLFDWISGVTESVEIALENPYYFAKDNVVYSKTDKSVVKACNSVSGKITLWDEVRLIPDYAFANCVGLTEVVFPIGAREIGESAFYGCTSLKAVELSSGLQRMGENAFNGCTALEKIELPALETINAGTFNGCTALAEVVFLGSVREIGAEAFSGCLSLQKVVLPDSLQTIGSGAFSGCRALTEIQLPDGLQTIGSGAFGGCRALTEIQLPESLTAIGDSAFSYCDALTHVKIGSVIKNIDASNVFWYTHNLEILDFYDASVLFYLQSDDGYGWRYDIYENGKPLTEIQAPQDVTELDCKWFARARALTSVKLHSGVTKLTGMCFENIYIDDIDAYCQIQFDENWQVTNIYLGGQLVEEISVTKANRVSSRAFYGAKIKKIVLGESIESVGEYAFAGSTIEEIVLSEGLEEIAPYLFYQCQQLLSLTLPNGVTTIGENAFCWSGLTEITFPETLTALSDNLFSYSSAVTVYNNSNLLLRVCDEENGAIVVDGVAEVVDKAGNRFYKDDSSFDICYVHTADGFVFGKSHGQSTPDKYSMSRYEGTEEKITVTGESLRKLGFEFDGTAHLNGGKTVREAHIANDITYAYFSCENLEKFTVEEGHEYYFAYDGVLYEKQTNLVASVPVKLSGTVRIYEGVTQLGSLDGEGANFSETNIQELILHDGITLIGKGEYGRSMFFNCKRLKKVTLGAGLNFIVDSAFSGCENLEEIVNRSQLTLTLGVMGSNDHGSVAHYAKKILDKDGNIISIVNGYEKIETADGFIFQKEYGEYYLREYVGDKDTVTLPTEINGNAYQLKNMYGAKYFIIPEGFTSLGRDAFKDSEELCGVSLPSTLEIVDSWAFYGCVSLKEIVIPNGVTSIQSSAFYNCKNLEKVVLPSSLREIGQSAFERCSNVREINLPSRLTSLGNEAFRSTALTEIVIPNGVESIPSDCFNGCGKLAKVTLGTGVKHIGRNAFYACALTSIHLPNGLLEIDSGAFNANDITSLVLPDSVTTVGENAFTALNEVTIGEGLTGVSGLVSTSLKMMTVNEKNEHFFAQDNILYAKDTKAIVFVSKEIAGEVTLWEEATTVGESAFKDCALLERVTLPMGLQAIEEYAFSGCTSLQEIVIPASVTVLGTNAFENCTALKTAVIKGDVTKIPRKAFSGCSTLEEIVLPSGLQTIEYYAFSGCSALANISLPTSVSFMDSDVFRDCVSLKEVVLPDGVSEVSSYMFYGCESLETVTLGKSVNEKFGWGAFWSCNNLKEIKISKEHPVLFDIDGVVYNRETKTLIFSPTAVEGVVTLWAELEKINTDGNGFGSGKVERFEIAESNEHYFTCDGILYDESSTSIYSIPGMLSGAVRIADGVKEINWELSHQPYITEYIFPSSVTKVVSGAFSGCSSLKRVVLPEGMTTVDIQIFSSCTAEEIVLPTTFEKFEGEIWGVQLNTVRNESDTPLYLGDYDWISKIINKNAVSWKEGYSGLYTQIGDFLFSYTTLIEYLGTETEVTFPADFLGKSYSIGIKNESFAKVKKATVPSGVRFASGAFYYNNIPNTALEEIVLEEGRTEISMQAFLYCTALKKVSLPNSLQTIGERAFLYCTALEEISLPQNLQSIGDLAFSGCVALTEVILPDSLQSIGESAFARCTALKKVVVGNQLQELGWGAFAECSALEEIILPDSLTVLGAEAFRDCTSLTKVYFGKGLLQMGTQLFMGCKNLAIVQSSNEGNFRAYDNVLYDFVNGTVVFVPKKIYGKITVPEGIKTINEWDFYDCSLLREITLADSVETLFISAFSDCDELVTLTLGAGLKNIESSLQGSLSIKTIYNRSSFTAEQIYTIFQEKGIYASRVYDADGSVYPVQTKEYEQFILDGIWMFRKEGDAYELYGYNGTSKDIVLPESVFGNSYKVASKAFYGLDIVSVTISKSALVTEIKDHAFYKCESLVNVTVENLYTVMDYSCFYDTPFYNNKENWTDGCLIVGGVLLAGTNDATHVDTPIYHIAYGAGSLNKLKYIVLGNAIRLNNYPNIQTVVYENCTIDKEQFLPSGLKTIVLRNCDIRSGQVFSSAPIGCTIYTDEEHEKAWDYYKGWNGRAIVYYGDSWITAKFYDENRALVEVGFYLTSQVIRQPYYYKEGDEQYSYRMLGWDVTGDGVADILPATGAYDLQAYAVVQRVVNEYEISFYDGKGGVYTSYFLPYGEEVFLPANPIRTGYSFLGWEGYEDGVTVTGALGYIALWEHDGNGHEYLQPTFVQPTCQEKGYWKHTCSLCEEWYGTAFVEKLPHEYQTVTVAPTCDFGGYDLHTCTVCGDSYKDNESIRLGHGYGAWTVVTKATCAVSGLQERTCERCSAVENQVISALGHSFAVTYKREATCAEEGVIRYECSVCQEKLEIGSEKVGHDYVLYSDEQEVIATMLKILGDLVSGGRNGNLSLYYCKVCEEFMTHSAISSGPIKGSSSIQGTGCEHSFGVATVVSAPDCTKGGVAAYACEKCGEYAKMARTPALGHDLTQYDGKAPTCTEGGWKAYEICSACAHNTYEALNATGHSHGAWTVSKPATCEENGEERRVCPNCGDTQTQTVWATGHKHGEWAVSKPATCEEEGEMEQICSVCGDTKTQVIRAKGHSHGDWQITTQPTCEGFGEEKRVCSVCGNTQTNEISPKGHNYGAWSVTTKATCETDGEYTRICPDCNGVERKPIVAVGHEFGSWTVTKKVTCEEDGKETSVCVKCQEQQVKVLTALGHSYSEWSATPTCETGVTAYKTCGRCQDTQSEYFGATGHKFSWWYTVREAKCEQAGEERRNCELCNKVESNVLTALEHQWGDRQLVSGPTCSELGLEYETCSICQMRKEYFLPKLEHELGDWLLRNPASCSSVGLEFRPCLHCSYEQIRELEKLPHELHFVTGQPATCTQQGYTDYEYCENCLYTTYQVINTLPHDYEWVVLQEPDQGVQGYREEICKNCGDVGMGETTPPLPDRRMETVFILFVVAVGGVGAGVGVFISIRKKKFKKQ